MTTDTTSRRLSIPDSIDIANAALQWRHLAVKAERAQHCHDFTSEDIESAHADADDARTAFLDLLTELTRAES